ncbi:MAG: insulinase family protein [Oligoflexia bacterium]|nr:insulinase family protein [Oligoflexia bacterium]
MKLLLLLLSFVFFYSCSNMEKKDKDVKEVSSIKSISTDVVNELITIKEVKESKLRLKFKNTDVAKIDLKVRKFILEKNGLTILLAENHHLPIVGYYTFFKVGSRYESKGITGATHFLEHMMFKGAKKYAAGKFDSIMEENGGSSNAYTSTDATVYHEAIPVAALEKIMDLESDRMENLLLDEKSFERERAVVLEERKLRYENSPSGKLFHSVMEIMYKGTPYGTPVIGEEKDLLSVQRDSMRKYFNKFYAPNNAILVIAGDIDVNKTLDLIKKYYGNIPPSANLQEDKRILDNEDIYKFKGSNGLGEEVKINANSNTPIFSIVYRGEKLGSKRYYEMDILSAILSAGASSYLVQKYVKGKKPILSSISLYNYSLAKNGLYLVTGELLNETTLENFKSIWHKDQKNFCKEGITERAVQKAKNQYLVGLFSGLETNGGVADLIGESEFYYNDYNYYLQELQEFNSIRLKDIMKVCEDIFVNNNNAQKKNYGFFSVWEKHPK